MTKAKFKGDLVSKKGIVALIKLILRREKKSMSDTSRHYQGCCACAVQIKDFCIFLYHHWLIQWFKHGMKVIQHYYSTLSKGHDLLKLSMVFDCMMTCWSAIFEGDSFLGLTPFFWLILIPKWQMIQWRTSVTKIDYWHNTPDIIRRTGNICHKEWNIGPSSTRFDIGIAKI